MRIRARVKSALSLIKNGSTISCIPNNLNVYRYLTLLCLLVGFATSGLGQIDRGAITGIIRDPMKNVIGSVDVVATNVATGVRYTTSSDESGNYDLRNLPLGNYAVLFRKEGFAEFNRAGISIEIGRIARIDVVLKVGSVSESVTVTANASVLQTEDATVGTDVNATVFRDLPQSVSGGRTIDTLAYAFTPTVSGSNWQTSVAGSQGFTKEVMIDGTSTDAYLSGWVGESSPSPEAIAEFKVDTAGISAEAARTGGGDFEFSMKSGTNSWHGSGAGFLTNEFLNANTFDNNWWIGYLSSTPNANVSQYKRERDRFYDYTGAVGGPIWKNKTFFYAAFEKYMQSDWRTNPSGATVPTTDFLKGNFGGILDTSTPLGTDSAGNMIYQGAIFDPTTGDVFPGNQIPNSRISPLAQKIISIYQQNYQPTNNNILNNYPSLVNSSPWFHQTQFSVKIDHTISDRQHLSGSFIYTVRPSDHVDDIWQNGNTTNAGPLDGGHQEVTKSPQYRLQDLYSITQRLVNVLSLTYSQERVENITMSQVAGDDGTSAVQLGFPRGTPYMPALNFGGVNGYNESSVGVPFQTGQFVGYNVTLNNALSWVKGRHTLKVGGELRDQRMNISNPSGALEYFFKDNTGVPMTLSSSIKSVVGFGFANFELGDVDNANSTVSSPLSSRRWVYSLFAEDNIKVTRNLTVNVSLRWDANSRLLELNGNWGDFDTNAINPAFDGLKGAVTWPNSPHDSFETNENWGQFGPHVGAAYQLSHRLVVRGSYGLFYVPMELNGYNPVPYGSTGGMLGVNQFVTPGNDSVGFNWDQNIYAGTYTAPTKNLGTYIPWPVTTVDPDTDTLGRTQNWNVGGQYEIAKDTRLEVSYTGNMGRKLHDGSLMPLNSATWSKYSSYLSQGANLGAWISDASDAAQAGVPYPYEGFQYYAYAAIKPYPQTLWNPLYFSGSPLGHSSYNAMVAEVTSKGKGGLTLDFSYTLQDGRGNTSSAFIESYTGSYWLQDPYAYNSYAKYPNTAKQIVKGYLLYNLPFGPGKRFSTTSRILNSVIGGWEIGTAHSYSTGTPMTTPGASASAAGTLPGWPAVYENVVAHPNLKSTFKRVNEAWNGTGSDPGSLFFDTSNFSDPAPGQLGNAPFIFSQWHSFGYNNEDMSLLRNVRFGADDRYRVQLRAEFFDVLNRHHWDGPNMSTGTAYYGHISGASGNRTGQLGMRFDF